MGLKIDKDPTMRIKLASSIRGIFNCLEIRIDSSKICRGALTSLLTINFTDKCTKSSRMGSRSTLMS